MTRNKNWGKFVATLAGVSFPSVAFGATQTFQSITGTNSGNSLLDLSSTGNGNLIDLLNKIYLAGVGAVAVLAVVMIIWGGIQVVGENVLKNANGKEKIWNAVWGLLLALGSFIILQTISSAFTDASFATGSTLQGTTGGSATTGNDAGNNNNPLSSASTGGTTSGNAAATGGTIAQNTQNGLMFPDQSWNDAARQAVIDNGLLDLSPSDAAKYFPNGQPTADGYVSLLASIANSESGFNANDNMNHSQGTDVGNTYSVGLFSLSGGDGAVKSLGYSEQDLGDPYKSINAATVILKNQITNSGSITGGAGTGVNGHYWGPLYNNK